MLVLLFADPALSAPPLEYSPGKRFVDFSTARQREVIQRVAKKTRKRGQVCTLDVLCVHVLFHALQCRVSICYQTPDTACYPELMIIHSLL